MKVRAAICNLFGWRDEQFNPNMDDLITANWLALAGVPMVGFSTAKSFGSTVLWGAIAIWASYLFVKHLRSRITEWVKEAQT